MMKLLSQFALAAALGLSYASSVLAADEHTHMHAHSDAAQAGAMSEGEVKKVDRQAGRITIKHGPLENLGMPGMTMAFRVKDAAMLDQVKVGDRIRFVAGKAGAAYSVERLEVVK
ncbi:MAG: copper-binding protein [Bacillota bacterium]